MTNTIMRDKLRAALQSAEQSTARESVKRITRNSRIVRGNRVYWKNIESFFDAQAAKRYAV